MWGGVSGVLQLGLQLGSWCRCLWAWHRPSAKRGELASMGGGREDGQRMGLASRTSREKCQSLSGAYSIS